MIRRLACRLLNVCFDSTSPSLALKVDAHRDLVAFSDMPYPELVRRTDLLIADVKPDGGQRVGGRF